MLKPLALALIRVYQAHLSPRKGFSCAYRVCTGGMGCSGFGKHAIEKHGFFAGMRLLRRRTAKCAWHAHSAKLAVAAAALYAPALGRNPALKHQGGFIDADCVSCDGCDVPSCDLPACETPSLESFACDACDIGGEVAECWFTDRACLDRCNPCGGSGYERESKRRRILEERRRAKAAHEAAGEAVAGPEA